MHRLLKNTLRGHITTSFRGREMTFRSKSAQKFNMELEEEEAKYRHWLKVYGGLIVDITPEEVKRGERQL